MNKKALGLVGLGAVAAVGGTLAYFNNTATLDNPLTTGHYSNQLVEEFTPPPTDLEPGAEWEKKVGATNTGDYPVLVRIRMEEEWGRPDANGKYKAYKKLSSTDETNPGMFLAQEWDAATGIGYDKANNVFHANQPDGDTADKLDGTVDGIVKDGQTPDADATTVHKNLVVNKANDKSTEGWYYNPDDGFWYWTRVLESNDKTGNLMESLLLASNLDTGVYETKEYYQIAEKGKDTSTLPDSWIAVDWTGIEDTNGDKKVDIIDFAATNFKGDNAIGTNEALYRKSEVALKTGASGYADSTYTLKITAEFVEASTDAVAVSWPEVDDILTLLPGIQKDGDTTVLVNR